MFDLVIRHGTLIDGSHAPRRRADVAIHQGRIAEVSPNAGRGREEIDARGRIVAPGFIDSHTHDDLALLVEPAMTPKISQGVTTCVCGNCGVSLAPLPDGELPEPLNLVSPAGRPRFGQAHEYLQALREQPAAVNSVPLLGHSALRACVMSRTDRPARDNEIAAMRELARGALHAGYHGISTGTFYAAAAQATTAEIIEVCAPLKELGGVFATHMRDEGDHVLRSLDETATIGRALGVQTIVSHHKVAGRRNHGRSRETLAHIAALQARDPATLKLALDCYPYIAASTVLRADRVAVSERTVITTCASRPELVGRERYRLGRRQWTGGVATGRAGRAGRTIVGALLSAVRPTRTNIHFPKSHTSTRHPPPEAMMTQTTEPQPASAYTVVDAHAVRSTALTRGPWHPDHQHAGPPIALVCRNIERAAHLHGLTHISRLTANLLRPVPIGELAVEVATDYAGRNAGHFSARLIAGGKEVARFTALAQRENDVTLPDKLPGHPLPMAPKGPDESANASFPFASKRVGYADLVETRVARGHFFNGPCAIWFRLRHPLLDGEIPSVYQRVAVAADSGNGISAILDFARYSFVNSDLTINLLRRPHGEWICLDARTHLGPDGCGLAESALFDVQGLIGVATQSLSVRVRE